MCICLGAVIFEVLVASMAGTLPVSVGCQGFALLCFRISHRCLTVVIQSVFLELSKQHVHLAGSSEL